MTAALIAAYLIVGVFHIFYLKHKFPASEVRHPKGLAQFVATMLVWPIIHIARFRNTPERVAKRQQAAEHRKMDAFTAAMSRRGREEAARRGTPVPQYLLDAEEKWAQNRAAR